MLKKWRILCITYFVTTVRVDLTKPVAGEVADGGLADFKDQVYSASKSTYNLQWRKFFDPESGIREYNVDVYRTR